ncbi:hypothetical protein BDN70DRAFT_575110 [Pholiota conissans]|uniref:Uncharacterized protein n=1 Tax=Pholiota conissans TaxID=109636 RepID=A0A9P6CM66_9AGAR|nr:hypothetical protein BDN70DRAFT_575110 [Pholiota conissans]
MLFSFKRLLVPAIGALALLRYATALPVPTSELSERGEVTEQALLNREFIGLNQREFLDTDDTLLERDDLDLVRRARGGGRGQITKQPKANPYKSKAKTPAPAPARNANHNQNRRKALPNNTKLRLSDDARGELNKMGLHGKARKNTIKWHKNQVKKAMRTHPALKGKAHTGVIQHLAHKGGSDPREHNHITASFLDKHRQPVPNSFNGGNNHHLYVKNKGMPGQAKAGWNKNNADIRGNSEAHQKTLSRTRTPGKSSSKGKGKQNSEHNFSKNSEKGFQRKGGN